MPVQTKQLPTNGTKLQVIGILLMVLSIFGVVPLIVHLVLKVILGNPAVNTTGLAVVNIGTLLSVVAGLIVGASLTIIGTRRKANYAKSIK